MLWVALVDRLHKQTTPQAVYLALILSLPQTQATAMTCVLLAFGTTAPNGTA